MKNYVVVDIDGTIAKIGDRLKLLGGGNPDWDKFYDRCDEDEPITEMVDLVNSLACHYLIVYCTGRRDTCRDKTLEWLKNHGLSEFDGLLMRKTGDRRVSTEVKPELLKDAGIKLNDIAFVLEDWGQWFRSGESLELPVSKLLMVLLHSCFDCSINMEDQCICALVFFLPICK
jgi:hypothetical protein